MRGPHHSSIEGSIVFFTSAEWGEKKTNLSQKKKKRKKKQTLSQQNQTVAGRVRLNGDDRRWNMLQKTPRLDVAEVLLFPSLSASLGGRACRLPGWSQVCEITPGCGVRLRCQRDVSLSGSLWSSTHSTPLSKKSSPQPAPLLSPWPLDLKVRRAFQRHTQISASLWRGAFIWKCIISAKRCGFLLFILYYMTNVSKALHQTLLLTLN